jgi:trypsin
MIRTLFTVASTLFALAVPACASAVVGGTAVESGRYSYVVAISDGTGAYCGGTLIAPRVVLTAAHCITERRTALARLRVLVGSASIRASLTAPEADHVLGVSAVAVHPQFSEQSMRYDAALVILDRAITSVAALRMADRSPAAGTAVSAAGWGETAERASAVPDHLRRVALTIAATRACKRGSATPAAYHAPSMVCASGPGRDTCAGDSGGPLVGTVAGHPALVGITSFGYGCARIGHPGVYTRVSAIRGWALSQADVLVAAFPARDASPQAA